jgi:hypothetical protein
VSVQALEEVAEETERDSGITYILETPKVVCESRDTNRIRAVGSAAATKAGLSAAKGINSFLVARSLERIRFDEYPYTKGLDRQ